MYLRSFVKKTAGFQVGSFLTLVPKAEEGFIKSMDRRDYTVKAAKLTLMCLLLPVEVWILELGKEKIEPQSYWETALFNSKLCAM